MRHEMSDVQRFLNQNKELHNTAQTMELFTDKFLAYSLGGESISAAHPKTGLHGNQGGQDGTLAHPVLEFHPEWFVTVYRLRMISSILTQNPDERKDLLFSAFLCVYASLRESKKVRVQPERV